MIKEVKYFIKEHVDNINIITKLAIIDMKKQTIRTTLGVGWVYIHDISYLIMFIFFRILMAGNGEIEGMHNVVYLITGLIPWFYMSEVLSSGSNAIKMNKNIIQSIKFPITIISTVEVIAILLKRLPTFLCIFFVSFYYGYMTNFNPILFVYYMICMVLLMWTIALTLSAFVAVSSDFQQFYNAILRVLMFSLPIIWSFEKVSNMNMGKILTVILRINPMAYVLNGFRNAFVLGDGPNLIYTIYFWSCVLVLFIIGGKVQYKLRNYYSDFM